MLAADAPSEVASGLALSLSFVHARTMPGCDALSMTTVSPDYYLQHLHFVSLFKSSWILFKTTCFHQATMSLSSTRQRLQSKMSTAPERVRGDATV